MTQIYVTNIIEFPSKRHIAELEEKFSSAMVLRIELAPNKSYQLKRITSRLMLIKIFEELNIDLGYLKTMYHNKKGKLQTPNIHLNISISYSDTIAVCSISDKKIGVDVENITKEIKPKSIKLLEEITSKKIVSSYDFYKRWTTLESIVKIYDRLGVYKVFGDKNFFKKNHYTSYALLNNTFLIALSSRIYTPSSMNSEGFMNTFESDTYVN